ncbi:MAG: outer membrane protein [Vicinamibacterales bacterium]
MTIYDRIRPVSRVIAALAFSAALTTTAAAQPAAPQTTTTIDPGYWTVTPFVGLGFSGDLDGGTAVLGGAAGYVWNPRISFEGEFSILPSSENSGLVEVDSTVWALTGNLLYHFTGREWVPYAAAGLGIGRATVDVNGSSVLDNFDTASTKVIANFGGGVERLIANNVGFRGDLRYQFGADLVPDYWRATAGITFGFRRP